VGGLGSEGPGVYAGRGFWQVGVGEKTRVWAVLTLSFGYNPEKQESCGPVQRSLTVNVIK